MEFIIENFDDSYIDILITQYKDTKFFSIYEKVSKLQDKNKCVDGTLLLKMMGKKIVKQIILIHSKDILLTSLRKIGGDKYIEPIENSIYLS
jgi:hypothetical protein